jgi:hypothetical protein
VPDRIDTTNVRRLTMHCRQCQHKVGERVGPWAHFGEVKINKRVQVHCANCGHHWYENTSRAGYDGDVPRTSES